MINKYNYKPTPQFLQTDLEPIPETIKYHPTQSIATLNLNNYKTPYYGIEIEAEQNSSKNANIDIFKYLNIINKLGFYIKTDGSLDNGLELVSHPTSYKYWIYNKRQLEHLLSTMRNNGWSTQSGRCGLHIHIGLLNFMSRMHFMRFAKLLLLLQGTLVYFSKRTERSLQAYATPIKNITQLTDLYWEVIKNNSEFASSNAYQNDFSFVDSAGHHSLLNVTKDTLEIRIFRGTLSSNRIINYIKFLESIRLFTANIGYPIVTIDNYATWLKEQDEFKVISSYLKFYYYKNETKVKEQLKKLRYKEPLLTNTIINKSTYDPMQAAHWKNITSKEALMPYVRKILVSLGFDQYNNETESFWERLSTSAFTLTEEILKSRKLQSLNKIYNVKEDSQITAAERTQHLIMLLSRTVTSEEALEASAILSITKTNLYRSLRRKFKHLNPLARNLKFRKYTNQIALDRKKHYTRWNTWVCDLDITFIKGVMDLIIKNRYKDQCSWLKLEPIQMPVFSFVNGWNLDSNIYDGRFNLKCTTDDALLLKSNRAKRSLFNPYGHAANLFYPLCSTWFTAIRMHTIRTVNLVASNSVEHLEENNEEISEALSQHNEELHDYDSDDDYDEDDNQEVG